MTDPAIARLLREQCYIDGQWCAADSGEQTPVNNPATDEMIACVPAMGESETRRAIAAARAALPGWAGRSAAERGAILRAWGQAMMDNQDALARLMTMEQGKPLAESRGEIAYAASFFSWFAEEGRRAYGEIIPPPATDRRLLVIRHPVGVVAAITPWNFPSAMITRKCAPALAAGCPIVIKPAAQTPLSALALAVLAAEVGVPPGVLNIICGPAAPVGRVLCASADVRKLSFTGSTGVGKVLLRQAADTVKRVSMELGGNAPFIVFDDADPAAAIRGAMASKFRNSGQTCVCANRILVQDGIHDEFTARLIQEVGALNVGDGLDPDTHQGPLIDQRAVEKVEAHIADAVAHGARVACGGRRGRGTFFEPTVLLDVTPAMACAREETFGPLAPVFRFRTEEEAIAMANDTPFGLAAYFYSQDISRVMRVAEALEYGMVGLNEGILSTEVAPFGGVKESGIGREGSRHGIDEYLEMKYLCLGNLSA